MSANPIPVTVGIDNGSTGSIGILLGGQVAHFGPMPTQQYLHYGKRGSVSERLDRKALYNIIFNQTGMSIYHELRPRVFIERPFTGKFINAVIPAHRFFEATIITLEDLELGYEVVDSGDWQKHLLGGVKGSANLKRASMLRGLQLYPDQAAPIRSQKDADGLLIAHHYHYRHHAP